jgi:hypothetical protein
VNPVTPEQVKEAAEKYREAALQDLDTDPQLPEYAKKEPRVREVVVAGYWLKRSLMEDQGVGDDIARNTTFAHGQMSFFRDPYKVAAMLYNNALMGHFPEPGKKLADDLNEQHLRVNPMTPDRMQQLVAEISAAIEKITLVKEEPAKDSGLEGYTLYGGAADGWRIIFLSDFRGGDGTAMKDQYIVRLAREHVARLKTKIST